MMTNEGQDCDNVNMTATGGIGTYPVVEDTKCEIREHNDVGDGLEVVRHKLNPFVESGVVHLTRRFVDGCVLKEIHGEVCSNH